VLTNSKANIFIFDDNYPRPTCIHKSNWQNYKLWPWKQLISLVVSPSIPTNNSKNMMQLNLPFEIMLKLLMKLTFFETEPKAKIVGITGTNGKSTTVALLYHILNFQ
jgi:UDP-N-acetylmuramoylalanine-D-glutamate ligase